MSQFEYKVIPTPRRPRRAKGVKGEPARFANALTEAINEIAVGGWEFYKTETLPMDAKPGIFSKRIETFQSVMVFRRTIPVTPVEEVGPVIAPVVATDLLAENDVQTPTLTAIDPEPENAPAFPQEDAPEPPSEPDESVEDEDRVVFDAENVDPLKAAVDAHKSSE